MKNLWIPLSAFMLGGIAGFIASQKILEKKYATFAQEEAAELKAFYKERIADMAVGLEEDESKNDTEEELPKPKVVTRSSIEKPQKNKYEEAKENYHLIFGKDDESRDDAGMGEEELTPPVNREEPYEVASGEFLEEYSMFDKVSLYYYKKDNVLCDEALEVIENVDDIVGSDILSNIGKRTTIWVRNEKLEIDYEIVALNKAYSEDVLGLYPEREESPREKHARATKGRSRKKNVDE